MTSPPATPSHPSPIAGLKIAEELFAAGLFPEAEIHYRRIAEGAPQAFIVQARLGHIALLANRLPEARRHLTRALELDPHASNLATLIAEVHYRQDDFAAAAWFFRRAQRVAHAEKLDALATAGPYRLEEPHGTAVVPWIRSEPVAVIPAYVNGIPANLVIDTGAGELILDAQFARIAGVIEGGVEEGWFAGGKGGLVRHGRIESLRLGEQTILGLPVELIELTTVFAPFLPGLPVHGILGTVVLSHFLATLDLRTGRLVLRPKHGHVREAPGHADVDVPFWLAGDHYLLVDATINRWHRTLVFLDTGMAGADLAVPYSTLHLANLRPTGGGGQHGYGGGGAVQAVPVMVDVLRLGRHERRGLHGMLLRGFPLEYQFGFRLGGLLARDFFHGSEITLDFQRMRLRIGGDRLPP